MNLETTYRLTFSRGEIVEALKKAYPDRLPVQAIPRQGDSNTTTPTLGLPSPDHVDIIWKRLPGTSVHGV